MLKYCLLSLIVVGQVFAVGLKPSFSLGLSASKYSWTEDWDGDTETNNFITMRLGATLPFSRIIGVTINILSLSFYDEGSVTSIGGGGLSSLMGIGGFSSSVGLIELLPISPVAPFFKQYITIDKFSSDDGYSLTYSDIGFSLGAEFSSSSRLKPVLEGFFGFGSEGYGSTDESISHKNYGVGFSIKCDL